jgi:catechol 2,3-dioxygenase-like lactoylglutathione lyase family enzyme
LKMLQVGLRVTHLERSLKFYTKALGLKIRERGDTRGWGGGLWVQLQDPRSRRIVELNWYPRGSLFGTPYTVGDGVDHVDFTIGVAPKASLERQYRKLVKNGGRPTGYSPATTDGWMASVRDPDGIWITVFRDPSPAERRAMSRASSSKK